MARCSSRIDVSWVTYFCCTGWFADWFFVVYSVRDFFFFCFFLGFFS